MAVVLITGCSSGFGLAATAAFAARGDQVIATMRDLSRRAELERATAAHRDRVDVMQLDVTDEKSRDDAISAAIGRYGRMDVLVNNAGVCVLGPAELEAERVVRAVFETNVFGPLAMMKAVIPHMRSQGGGRIVNVTSIGALVAPAFYATYAASKHALDAYAASLDLELGPQGIRCVTVAPGGHRTAMLDNTELDLGGTLYPQAAVAIERWRQSLGAATDLSPVTRAVLAAATDPEPALRYLVGDGMPALATPLANEAASLHELLRAHT